MPVSLRRVSAMSALGRQRPLRTLPLRRPLLGGEAAASYKPPRYARNLIINPPFIPSLPNLISQFLIKGFDVDFGEHGLRMACSWTYFMWQVWIVCAEIVRAA